MTPSSPSTTGAQPVDPKVVDLEVLAAWMDERGLGGGEIADVRPLAGGTQNLLLQFGRGGREYVLRRPPEHKRRNSDETMRREARVLAALAGSSVPHPGFIAGEPDPEVLGAAFYLMDPVDGFTATTGMPDLHRGSEAIQRQMGISFADAAAALGEIDHREVGLDGFGKPDGYLERQVPRWQSQLDSYRELDGYDGPEIPGLERVAQWLEANRPSDFTPGIIHGDFHLGNVMYRHDSGELAAVVDWELATVGDPLVDLGIIVAMWPDTDGLGQSSVDIEGSAGLPTVTEMIARYGEGSRRDVSAASWYGVLACYRTGIILEGTHARACAGRAPVEFGDLLHAVTLQLFERAGVLITRA